MADKKLNGGQSLRDRILAADDLPREPVEVEEWGLTVWVRTMTGTEKDRWEGEEISATENKTREGARARLLVRTLVDENGERIFTEADLKALGEKSSSALDRCHEVAARLNRVRQADFEFLIKNWLAARTDDSSSALP